MGPNFANRVSEVQENICQLTDLADVVEPVQHIAGELNPADLGTQGHASLAEVGSNSIWQNGPAFLGKLDQSKWPNSRQFRDCVPQTELRSRHEVTQKIDSVIAKINTSMELLNSLFGVSLHKSQGVLARLLRAYCYKGTSRRKKILTTGFQTNSVLGNHGPYFTGHTER